ncbi:MAG: hypothetical protein CL489_10430 [Acidobacteria bacterium]|nr:hypothetical protein [Acidobacteriota bacterium]|tara:strand:+ start:21133 stop:21879 length:747 start_codon:yes stop_codon:yes gene_type:complete
MRVNIFLEGIDGVGKTSLMNALKVALDMDIQQNREVLKDGEWIKEGDRFLMCEGYSFPTKPPTRFIKDSKTTFQMLFYHAQFLEVLNELSEYASPPEILIWDRSPLTTAVYNGGQLTRGLTEDTQHMFDMFTPNDAEPCINMLYYLSCPVEVCAKRLMEEEPDDDVAKLPEKEMLSKLNSLKGRYNNLLHGLKFNGLNSIEELDSNLLNTYELCKIIVSRVRSKLSVIHFTKTLNLDPLVEQPIKYTT